MAEQSSFQPLLTPDEQIWTAERILHDARLVRDGATISEMGGLIITAAQYYELVDGDRFQQTRSTWLNQGVTELLPSRGESSILRITNAIQRKGIMNCRDVLVAGRSKVGRVRHVGKQALSIIEEALRNDFGVEWRKEPTTHDIAALCQDLSEVNSIVLGEDPVFAYSDWKYGPKRMVLSVLDIVEEARGNRVVPEQFRGEWSVNLREEIRSRTEVARAFAVDFYLAQTDRLAGK